jgi:heme-degrading monooxygenase HmoA
MYFVSITLLRLRLWRYFPPFSLQAYRSAKQARSSEGNSAVAMLWESENTFWTRTVWSSEDAMKPFIFSGAHRQALPSSAVVR